MLNLEQKVGSTWKGYGFVLVDPVAKSAKEVRIDQSNTTFYSFAPDGSGVYGEYTSGSVKGLRLYGTDGTVKRELPGVGSVPAWPLNFTSPSQRTFTTTCPEDKGEICVWDSAAGTELSRFTSSCDKILGFYDDKHLYCWNVGTSRDQIIVIDLQGEQVRKLLDKPKSFDISPAFTVDPNVTHS
jgi:hypothetical protein